MLLEKEASRKPQKLKQGLTVFFPCPTEAVHPARHAETYVSPLSPHTGSHALEAHLQSELHSENTAFSWYGMGLLGSEV